MKKLGLQFQTIGDLASFQKLIEPGCYRIDTAHLILTCECDEEDVKKALKDFKAQVVILPFSTL